MKIIEKIKENPMFIVVPLMGGIVWGIYACSSINASAAGLGNINLWVNSFMATYVIFTLSTLVFDNSPFLKRNVHFKNLICFLITTLFNGIFSFTFNDVGNPDTWFRFAINLILGCMLVYLCFSCGYDIEKDKSQEILKKSLEDYYNNFKKMDKETRKAFMFHISLLDKNQDTLDKVPLVAIPGFYKEMLEECKIMDAVLEEEEKKHGLGS